MKMATVSRVHWVSIFYVPSTVLSIYEAYFLPSLQPFHKGSNITSQFTGETVEAYDKYVVCMLEAT